MIRVFTAREMRSCFRHCHAHCKLPFLSPAFLHSTGDKYYEVAIALGGNLGDTVSNFRKALDLLSANKTFQVTCYSRLYESAPAHITDQPRFLNAAISAKTPLLPHELLSSLKQAERALGRDPSAERYGPRPVDLDIIFFEDWLVSEAQAGPGQQPLVIPHPSWRERPFVLAPLADLAPPATPFTAEGGLGGAGGGPASSGLQRMLGEARHRWAAMAGSLSLDDIESVIPLPGGRTWRWQQQAFWIMGILNITPDSFSDGGKLGGVEGAVEQARVMVKQGAHILDVGGQSTRPGATRVSAEEEARRAIPVIRALAELRELQQVLISVDTFYGSVAEAAVEAGAHLVNDVSGESLDPLMHTTVAALGVPYVLMHMRGDPGTMQQPQHTQYSDVVADVAAELAATAQRAQQAGIEPWRIISDPGIGFAKSFDGNLQLMAHLRRFLQLLGGSLAGQPLLVGASRKGFLGKISGHSSPADRDVASAAALALSFTNGANILRTHNVAVTADALRVAAAFMQHGHVPC